MMRYLGLTTLEIRRRLLKTAFMYKVVEGRVPATNNEHCLKFQTKTYYKSYTVRRLCNDDHHRKTFSVLTLYALKR